MGKQRTRLEKPDKKMGRPPIEFDWELLDKILQFRPSLDDTATIMKCSADLVEKKIKSRHGITFSDYRNKRMANVRLTLVQKAIDMAKNGDRVMLIFTLKNLCGWCDNPEMVNTDSKLEGTLIIKARVPKDPV